MIDPRPGAPQFEGLAKPSDPMARPDGPALCRAFLPTRDFEANRAFYEALCFEKLVDGEVAVFDTGQGGFILQRYHEENHHHMMQLKVSYVVDPAGVLWHVAETRKG